MTNEQLAAYLEQLCTNLDRTITDVESDLHDQGIVYKTEKQYIGPIADAGMFGMGLMHGVIEYNKPENWETVQIPTIANLDPLRWFLENLQANILTLDPKRDINHDNH